MDDINKIELCGFVGSARKVNNENGIERTMTEIIATCVEIV